VTVSPGTPEGKAAPAKSAVFLIGTVDKPTALGYRAAHGDWLCWSATVFFGSGALIQTHMSKLRKGG
jgi:hypothetical protein